MLRPAVFFCGVTVPLEVPPVYLLYLDESGTHGGSPVFIIGGLALHEQDTWFMQQRLDNLLKRKLPRGSNHLDFELHAADIKSPKGPIPGKRTRTSEWLGMPYGTRIDILRAAYRSLSNYKCRDATYPCAFFGAVVDRSYADREERAEGRQVVQYRVLADGR